MSSQNSTDITALRRQIAGEVLTADSPGYDRAAYPGATWDRLRDVKAKYDPENLFHNNQNIPPAG